MKQACKIIVIFLDRHRKIIMPVKANGFENTNS